ncbi:MAG: hypothetical protein GY950_12870 [bacterium]|nr:hypothetical protein [bacterium]
MEILKKYNPVARGAYCTAMEPDYARTVSQIPGRECFRSDFLPKTIVFSLDFLHTILYISEGAGKGKE